MLNPRVSLYISLVGLILSVALFIFFDDDEPSAAVSALEWLFLSGSLLGLVGSLVQMSSSKRSKL